MTAVDTKAGVVRVVIVDDTPEIRKALRLSLQYDDRFQIVGEAGDGEQAITLASTEQPDAMVLDLAMPVMDGLQALPHIREVSPRTRIVVLSGFAADRMSKEAISRGADRYLTKGVEVAQLADELLEVCGLPSATSAPPQVSVELSAAEQQAIFVHQLRRPLGAVKGLAGALRAAADDADSGLLLSVADALVRNAEHAQQLAGQLLEAGPVLEIERTLTDLTALVRQELQVLSPVIDGRLVALTTPPAVQVRCDPLRVRQVVATLVSNAVEHTPADTPVEVDLAVHDDVVELTVRDHGLGIAPDRAKAVFTGPEAGAGLGLFVSRALARAHGGELRLERPEDGGCRFVLSLPASPRGVDGSYVNA